MARSGVHVAVEVLTSGRPLTSYHAAALRDSTPLSGDTPLRPASPPERVESVVAEVVAAGDGEPPQRAARGRARRAAGRPVRRLRRARAPARSDAGVAERTSPSRVRGAGGRGGGRRRPPGSGRARAAAQPGAAGAGAPGRGRWARSSSSRTPCWTPPDEGTWTDEWASGDWALAEDAPPPGPGGLTTAGGSAPGPHSSTAVPHDGRARLHEATAGDTTAGPEGATTGPLSTTPGPTGRPPGPFAAPRDAAPATPSAGPRSTASVPQDTTARPTGAFAGPRNGTAMPPAGFGVVDEAHAAEQAHPDNAPVGSHALFTDQTPPAVPHSAAPVAAIPPSQPPTPDTAPPERPTGGGPAHALAEPPTGPLPVIGGSPMAEALPQAGGPRPAERRRPRAAHPAPGATRGRRRERQHRPQRRRTRVTAPAGANPGLSSGSDQRARRPEARGDRRADPRRPRPTSRPHRAPGVPPTPGSGHGLRGRDDRVPRRQRRPIRSRRRAPLDRPRPR